MGSALVDADNPRSGVQSKTINYIRNSVKATVDAYDGSVKLYAWDTEDPMLKAWSKVFPDSLTGVEEMSADLLSHVRYPNDMFKVQRELLGKYHVTDADAFYSDEDAWRTPDDPVSTRGAQVTAAQPGQQGQSQQPQPGTAPGQVPQQSGAPAQPPYYLTLSAGKGVDPDYSIYSTYIPDQRGEGARDILTGYLAANSNAGTGKDGVVNENYGKLQLLVLPKGDTIPGPGQVQNSYNTDTQVSNLLNLLRQGETEVISGNLLTLPVGGGLLYVQPVYVKSSSGRGFPLLQKVLVSFGDKIAFEDTLDEALDTLFGGDSGAEAGDTGTDVTSAGGTASADPDGSHEPAGTGDAPATPEAPAPAAGTLEAALQEMKSALADREAALKAGDWTKYGEADARLQQAIEKALSTQ